MQLVCGVEWNNDRKEVWKVNDYYYYYTKYHWGQTTAVVTLHEVMMIRGNVRANKLKTNMQTRANLLQSSHHRITLKFTMRCRRLMKCDWGLMTGDVLMSRNVAVGWRGAKELKSFSQGWVIFLLSAAVQPWSCNETHPISVPLELRMRPNSTRRQMRMSNRSRPMYPSHLGGQLTN